ncbi:SCO6745 family protein [Nocardia sp. CA-119907]|uniref:SCO6745 family protein n=1 Tax=Nocardia sp. CA-119907 TaxID=3239973 RepID=UPI003D97B70B
MSKISPQDARLTFRALEPVHGMIYFTPHGPEVYRELGITDPRMMYFASRSAAFGPVPAEVTIGAFFNFNPAAVRAVLPAAWEIAAPGDILRARLKAVDRSLRQAWGDDVVGAEVREAADLARRAAERACERLHGRPLFGAHAALPWPDEPHLVLWHAQSLLREFRGDGHVALLLTEGLSGIEALITHSATGEIAPEVLRMSRSWSEQEWAAGVQGLRERGWLTRDEIALSGHGAARRQAIENRTDDLAIYPYEAIGAAGCERLQSLAAPLAIRVIEGDLGFPPALSERYRKAIRAGAR